VGRGHWLLEPVTARNLFSGTSSRVSAQPDHHGGMWFYNYGRGLVDVDADGQMRQMTMADGFPGDRVYCFSEDREGDWWAGLDAAGLVRVRARQFHVVPAGEKDLPTPARTICEDETGQVWIGQLSGGLGCWQNGNFTNFAVADNAGGDSVFCVCPGPGSCARAGNSSA
jgi:ligand-binding sensor domain-containing protein